MPTRAWIARIIFVVAGVAVSMATAMSPAAPQSSLTEVKCSFFADYADSGYESAAGMPLAIATSGDELPQAVALAFSAIESGEPTSLANQTAIAGFFGPLCNPAQSSAQSPGSNATSAVPPEQLASTGADRATTIIALVGVMLLGLGVVLVQEHGGGIYAWSGLLGPGARTRSAAPAPTIAPATRVEDHRPHNRFWLLTEDGE